VPDRRDTPFPFEAVRDLMGVVRALYAAAKHNSAGPVELARIARVGRDLHAAIDLAAGARKGTGEREVARRRAEEATLRAGDLVDALTPAEPLVHAARARVSGTRTATRKKSPDR
jgi:hypothetical protein